MSTSVYRAALCAALPALLAAGCATARPAPAPINSARLGIAKPTIVVPVGIVQLEGGASTARQDERTRYAAGETLLRVGVAKGTEARVGFPSYLRTETPAATVDGWSDVSVGVKHRLRNANGAVPALSVTLGATLPTGTDGIGAGEFQPEGAVSADWGLPHAVRGIATAAHRSGVAAGDRFGQTTLAAGARRAIAPNVLGQLDYARVVSTRAGAVGVNQLRAGTLIRVIPTLQLDAWAGRASSGGKHEHLFGVGIAHLW